MKSYNLIIDSTVYIPKKMIKDHDIKVASLNVITNGVSYREVEIDNQFIFDKQDQEKAKFTTSQPAPGEFFDLYKKAFKQGYEQLFVVCLSKNISGTYQSALLAKNMLDDPSKVHIFDTSLAAYGTEMIAIEVVEMMDQDKSKEEIISRIEKIIATSNQMFTVENLFSLSKGGRLSLAQAAIGTVLRVKPIIKIVDGKLKLINKERTYKKVHRYFLETVKEEIEGYDSVTFYVTHTHSPDRGEQLVEDLKSEFPDAKLTFTDYLGPVFSIHVGRKGYGLSWFAE